MNYWRDWNIFNNKGFYKKWKYNNKLHKILRIANKKIKYFSNRFNQLKNSNQKHSEFKKIG